MNKIVDFNKYTFRKSEIRMCTQINKIYGKTAMDILNEYGNPNVIPINLKGILEKIGISALPMDFSRLESQLDNKHILGLVLSNSKNAVIYYSKADTPNRQRFTIAHELGHICNHLKPDTNDYPYIDWRIEEEAYDSNELKANIFAGELLIPLHKLTEIYLSMPLPTSSGLASYFGVSIRVMEERLKYLGVSYYTKEGQAVTYGTNF